MTWRTYASRQTIYTNGGVDRLQDRLSIAQGVTRHLPDRTLSGGDY